MNLPKLLLCTGLSAGCCFSYAQTVATAPVGRDSIRQSATIRRQVHVTAAYPFIRYQHNAWQWARPSAVAGFFSALRVADSQRVTVVHIGDSHVQADVYPHVVRTRLQQLFGSGGRGMVFPYSAARTHAGADYVTYHHGPWAFAKNIHPEPILPLGLTGYTIHTRDVRAGLKLAFTEQSMLAGNTRVRLWVEPSRKAFDLRLYYGDPQPIVLSPSADTSKPYIEALLPYAPNDLQILLQQTADSSADRLEVYGISLDSPLERGLLYHSVGVNGATFDAVLRQSLMDSQLKTIDPDLIVFDISGNEYYGRPFDPIDFAGKLRQCIARLRASAPSASILITCSQDIYRRIWNVAATAPASAVAQQVAFQEGCAFYNYYEVAGGSESMLRWREAGLAKRDRVHLTNDGYRVKGELFTNALLTSYAGWLDGAQSFSDTLSDGAPRVLVTEHSGAPPVAYTPKPRSAGPPPGSTVPKGTPTVHIVRPGEVLGTIAQRYRVGVSSLRAWNNLRSNLIYAGQKLMIYTNGAPSKAMSQPSPASVTRPPSTIKTPSGASASETKARAGKVHTVRSGESLWTIARKYDTSVASLKKLNALRTEALRPGQKIRVP
jgi:LysM repeat protein